MKLRETVNGPSHVTQRELVARFTHDPVVIEPVGVGYRIALYDDADAPGVVMRVQPRVAGVSSIIGPEFLVEVSVHGATLRLTRRQAAMLAGCAQRLIGRWGVALAPVRAIAPIPRDQRSLGIGAR